MDAKADESHKQRLDFTDEMTHLVLNEFGIVKITGSKDAVESLIAFIERNRGK